MLFYQQLSDCYLNRNRTSRLLLSNINQFQVQSVCRPVLVNYIMVSFKTGSSYRLAQFLMVGLVSIQAQTWAKLVHHLFS
jgi:hypothetical protein